MLLGCNSKLIVKRVVPDLLHIIPIGYDSMLDGILECQHTTLALSLITNIAVLLVHADHNPRHLRPPDDGREDCARRIVASEACLAHTGTIVDDERGHLILVGHGC